MPEGTGRIVTAEELARFAECRLAWWYDRTHPLAGASGAELARRVDLLGAVYGPGARDLPEYQMLTHLRDRAVGAPVAAPKATPRPDVRPLDPPHRLITGVVLIAAVVIGCVLASIVFALTAR
jgi:hypothetical protein